MKGHEIAEKFAVKNGFRVVDYIEVGLPVYYVVLQVSTLLRKRIPPIEEFVMRSLNVGMPQCSEVAAFLGLDETIVGSVVSSLIRENLVCLAGVVESARQTLRLTDAGKRALEQAEAIVPEDRTVSLHFDALLRTPTYYREELMKFRELRQEGLKEIPAIPPRQPKPSDFPVQEIQDLFHKVMPLGEKRDLLTVKRVERSNRLFRRGMALLYESMDSSERHVDFIVDGKLTPDYGIAFTKADGLRILGFERAESHHAQTSAGRSAVAEMDSLVKHSSKEMRAEGNDALKIQAEISAVKDDLGRTENEAARQQLEEQLVQAKERLSELEAKQKKRGVRQVYVYEHPRLLEKAFNGCQDHLMIISPWIRAQVVNHDFLHKLKDVLKRGVKVYIGYGIMEKGKNDLLQRDQQAEQRLLQLAKKHPNFVIRCFGDTHAKVLICDNKFVVTGSFNWLSYKGDPDRTFRDEQSALVEIPEHVEGVFRENLKRFESLPSSHSDK